MSNGNDAEANLPKGDYTAGDLADGDDAGGFLTDVEDLHLTGKVALSPLPKAHLDSSNKGDAVLAFGGCGISVAAAEALWRSWVGGDLEVPSSLEELNNLRLGHGNVGPSHRDRLLITRQLIENDSSDGDQPPARPARARHPHRSAT